MKISSLSRFKNNFLQKNQDKKPSVNEVSSDNKEKHSNSNAFYTPSQGVFYNSEQTNQMKPSEIIETTPELSEEYKKNKDAYLKIPALMKQGYKAKEAIHLALLDDKHLRYAQNLIDNYIETYTHGRFVKTVRLAGQIDNDEMLKRIQVFCTPKILFNFSLGNETVLDVAKDEKAFNLTIKAIANNEGKNFHDLEEITNSKGKEGLFNFLSMIEKDINFDDASNILLKTAVGKRYENFKKVGYDDKISSVLANIKNIDYCSNESANTLADLISNLDSNSKGTERISEIISSYVRVCDENVLKDILPVCEYLKKLDIEKLHKIAPYSKNFSAGQLFNFAEYHSKNEQADVSKLELKYPDLTSLVQNKYVSESNMSKLLGIFPLTERKIGELPKDWLKSRSKDEKEDITNEVYSLIGRFQKIRNTEKLEEGLKNILQKNVSVEPIGEGKFGICYKVSVEGCRDCCLKIFYKFPLFKAVLPVHGAHVEPQAGMFLNSHSKDFVKMYFGKVAGKNDNDGFLVTQFLDEKTVPYINQSAKADGYKIHHFDLNEENMVKNITIDYGGAEIYKNCTLLSKNANKPK